MTGQHRKILREAILGAYPNPDDLQILLSEQMDVEFSAIARGDAYNNKVFALIQDFEADGRIEKFIRAVVNDKPTSPYLAAIKNEFANLLDQDNLDQENLIGTNHDYPIKVNMERSMDLDRGQLMTTLNELVPQQDNTLRSVENDISIEESHGNFYVVRDRLEKRCYEEILKPGILIRIKSPDKMGKSLLMSRVLDAVSQNGYRTAIINLREANQEIFADINQFLKWFCAYVSDQLNIDQNPDECWKKFLGANPNCTKYFETYLLSGVEQPLVIAIDNFDCIFEHPNIETDFCGLLRGWFEKVNANKVWGKLRQIIVYSQETYGTKDINQSPLNVGFPIELVELDSLQVLALAKAYRLPWTEIETEKLMNMIGGHPYLVQIALDGIAHQDIVLDNLLKIAPTEEGIYGDYLNERLQRLEENPALEEAIKKIVNSDVPTHLGAKETFKLDSMGLIKRQGSDVVPRCNLYRLYFRDRLR